MHVVADRQRHAGVDVERAERRVAPGRPGAQRLAPHLGGLLRQVERRLPALGELGGERHVLRPDRGDGDRDAVPDRVVDQLERLAEAGALAGGSGTVKWRPVYSSGSRRQTRRQISIVSRVLPIGASNGTPWKPSITCGPDVPMPSSNRPSETSSRPGRGHRQHGRGAGVQLQDAGGEVRGAVSARPGSRAGSPRPGRTARARRSPRRPAFSYSATSPPTSDSRRPAVTVARPIPIRMPIRYPRDARLT